MYHKTKFLDEFLEKHSNIFKQIAVGGKDNKNKQKKIGNDVIIMKKNMQISKEELQLYIQQFYEYFENGYEFEDFLKLYLEKIGLDEVSVTQRSRDGGVDLIAIRIGIGGFSNTDAVNYYVQAKRYKPTKKIPDSAIRELKGTIPFGHKGIFITTAKYSRDAVKEANNDPSKPVVLIDGKDLIESCIDNELGFVYTPNFSTISMNQLMGKEERDGVTNVSGNRTDEVDLGEGIVVEKYITNNDIRARILPVPRIIMNAIPAEDKKIEVEFNEIYVKKLSISKDRRFLSGVTDVYRRLGIIGEDGTYHPVKANWNYLNGKIFIKVIA